MTKLCVNRFVSRRWMVGHLFCRIYADVVLQYSDIPLEKWHILLNPMMHRGGFTCAVCDKWHTRQVNYSPLCCTPLRLSKGGGLNTRGKSSHFILIFYRWGKIKMHYTVQKLCFSSAGFWTGLAASCGVCFMHAGAKFCLKKQVDTVSFWHCVCLCVHLSWSNNEDDVRCQRSDILVKLRLNKSQTHCQSEPWPQPALLSTEFLPCLFAAGLMEFHAEGLHSEYKLLIYWGDWAWHCRKPVIAAVLRQIGWSTSWPPWE